MKMNRYYLAHVVTEKEYGSCDIGAKFGTGVIVEGLLHEKDLIIITVHENEDDRRINALGIDVV